MVPGDLVLRCFGYKTRRNTWVAKCIDLDLVTEEDTLEASKESLRDAIVSYMEVVLNTEDKDSIADLLRRTAPLADHIQYHLIKFLCKAKCPPNKARFDQNIPIRLAEAF
jgi:hypothetical protein